MEPPQNVSSPLLLQADGTIRSRDLAGYLIDTKTVMKHLDEFRAGLIVRRPKRSYPYFEANRLSIDTF